MADRNSRELSLDQRIQALEDKFAIQQLIISYSLVVDSGAVEVAASVWTADGVFDRGAADPEKHSGNFEGAYGLDTILKEVGGSALQASLAAGLCHVMTAPQITISGDSAVATGYTLMIGRDGAEFRIRRPTANRWELVRDGDEWKIKRRTLRPIDGSPAARELLGQAVQTNPPPETTS